MTRGKTLATMMGMLAMAEAMNAGLLYPETGTRTRKGATVNGNFSGSGTPANLKKNRKKPVTMRRPKSKKRKH